MVEESKRARVYRFGDYVAFSVDGPQVYVSAELARQLSGEFARYADDISARKFTASTLGTTVCEMVTGDGMELPEAPRWKSSDS